MEHLNKYYEILSKYKRGEFGEKNLSMHEILHKAQEPDLLNQMDTHELQHLINTSSGITKHMFNLIKKKREEEKVERG